MNNYNHNQMINNNQQNFYPTNPIVSNENQSQNTGNADLVECQTVNSEMLYVPVNYPTHSQNPDGSAHEIFMPLQTPIYTSTPIDINQQNMPQDFTNTFNYPNIPHYTSRKQIHEIENFNYIDTFNSAHVTQNYSNTFENEGIIQNYTNIPIEYKPEIEPQIKTKPKNFTMPQNITSYKIISDSKKCKKSKSHTRKNKVLTLETITNNLNNSNFDDAQDIKVDKNSIINNYTFLTQDPQSKFEIDKTLKLEDVAKNVETKPEQIRYNNLYRVNKEYVEIDNISYCIYKNIKIPLVIYNIVGDFSLNCHVNVKHVARYGHRVAHNAKRNTLEVNLCKPRVTATVRPTGKVIVFGAKSLFMLKVACVRIGKMVRMLDHPEVKFTTLNVNNVMCGFTCFFTIVLTYFFSSNKNNSYYNPEIDSSVEYRYKGKLAVIKIHWTGAITVIARKVKFCVEAVKEIFPKLYEARGNMMIDRITLTNILCEENHKIDRED
ncbi:hypothetical protein A3Q56_04731 [Intoshia linei]|uniref:TATA box-binding protein-like 1 n=1 Tax=Intoshia linei TaxID=1819745 RepID=A0A177AZU0_9BILA|nr:hypothetical protein A3Q56_04731 [Intoshia linei]